MHGSPDHAVTAHRAPAFVVHEEHAGNGRRAHGLGQQRAIHVGMAARLEHQRPSQMIDVALGPGALVEHRLAFGTRKAVHNQAQRLTGRMRVDSPDAVHHCA
jgi:hypothetical protein